MHPEASRSLSSRLALTLSSTLVTRGDTEGSTRSVLFEVACLPACLHACMHACYAPAGAQPAVWLARPGDGARDYMYGDTLTTVMAVQTWDRSVREVM